MAENKFDRINRAEKAVSSADLKSENKESKQKKQIEMKFKKLRYPTDWEDAIEENHTGTTMSYILMAIKNQLEKDGYI